MIPKFRAWDKKEKEWLEIKLLGFWEDNELWYLEIESGELLFEDDLGIKWELLQSTGIKDKNGVEIYEKDIVRDSYGDVFLIEWLDNNFVLADFFFGGYEYCCIDNSEAYEVIGNKYEHPNLLEE